MIKEIQEKPKRYWVTGRLSLEFRVEWTLHAFAILAPVLGKQLKAFLIDTGGMRKGEIEKIKNIAKSAKINLNNR